MKANCLLLPVCLILAGCANIRSKQPVGGKPLDLSVSIGDLELEDIAGEWVNADGEVSVITVVDAEKGMVIYAPRNPGEDGKPVKVELRQTGDDVFANFEPNEDGERSWFLLAAGGNLKELIVWEPDTTLFRKLIAEGRIKGTSDPETRLDDEGKEVKNHHPGAVIDDPEGEWVKKMLAGEFGVLMDWRHPHVLRKVVKDEEGPSKGEAEAGGEDPGPGKGVESEEVGK